MGRWLIDFSKVLGKPINEADLRGAGVSYSRWEKGESIDTRKCCRSNTYQANLQFVPCGSLGLARGCLVAETVTRLRLGGTVESGSNPGTPYISS